MLLLFSAMTVWFGGDWRMDRLTDNDHKAVRELFEENELEAHTIFTASRWSDEDRRYQVNLQLFPLTQRSNRTQESA